MIRDPCAATKSTGHGRRAAVKSRRPKRPRLYPRKPRSACRRSGSREAGRPREGQRRKAFAADRPPEGLGRKSSPSPEAARGEKGGGNLAVDVAREDAAVGQFFETTVLGCSRIERRRRQGRDLLGDNSSVAPGSSASSRIASAASNQASFGSSSGGGSDASPSPTKMVSGKDRPTPSTDGMNAPIIASPQKSAPSQKRQIGARL